MFSMVPALRGSRSWRPSMGIPCLGGQHGDLGGARGRRRRWRQRPPSPKSASADQAQNLASAHIPRQMIDHDMPAKANHKVADANREQRCRFRHRYIPIDAKNTANSPSPDHHRRNDPLQRPQGAADARSHPRSMSPKGLRSSRLRFALQPCCLLFLLCGWQIGAHPLE